MSIEFHHTELLRLKQADVVTFCRIVMIDGDKLHVKCTHRLNATCETKFKTKYFKGLATIEAMSLGTDCFNYTFSVKSIHFKPGIFVSEQV